MGDEAAFAEIFKRHGQELYRYCRAILGDPDDAQDALQNTMDRVLRALPGERRTIHLRPWLFRVARNESLTLIRNRDDTVELTDASVPAAPAADIRAEHREEVRTLVADLASLPESQRSALVLRELSGLSHDEVSEALQRSPRASRQAVYEARLALQDLREGRDMNCDEVRAAVSDGDGRVMRGRKIRSHLRGCRRCSDFALAIDQRKTQLDMLAPSLPAAAATGLIASVLGGGSAAGGLAGAGASAAGVVSGSVALKSAGIVAATLALGVGGASIAGVDVPLVGGSEQKEQAEEHLEGGATPGHGPEDGAPAGSGAGDRDRGERSQRDTNSQKKRQKRRPTDMGRRAKRRRRSAKSDPPAHSNAGGNSDSSPGPPAHSNAGGNSDGTTGPPEQSNAGGNSGGGTSTGPPTHSNAGGNSDSTTGPPEHSNAGGNSDKEK